jgi:prepilin-type N-terminal cleavage/methylation domain-containing protein
MIQKPSIRVPRSAFTLVELLVVMSIIAVLVSLTVGAAIQVLGKVAEARTRTDISELSAAVVNFETKMNVDYIPSKIRLLDSGAYDLSTNATGQPNTPLDFDSFTYIKRVWPRIQFPVIWTGTTNDVTLEGDQCLVFFLGGCRRNIIPGNPPQVLPPTFGQGFSSNTADPTSAGGTNVGPFYDFKLNRLVAMHPTSPGFPSYVDGYGKQPYIYFSSYKTQNGYNRYPGGDCPSAAVSPYFQGPPTSPIYLNPSTFQIISAGKDTKFGPGGSWSPTAYPAPGKDDMSNFYEKILGAP